MADKEIELTEKLNAALSVILWAERRIEPNSYKKVLKFWAEDLQKYLDKGAKL